MEDFPSNIFPVEFLPGYTPLLSFDPENLPKELVPRKATIHDVHGMSMLINEYAQSGEMLARGPQHLYQAIREYSVITTPTEQEFRGPLGITNEIVIASIGIHILWEDLAEIRSVAVHPLIKRKGVGTLLIDHIKNEARKLGIKKLFTFSMRPEFFRKQGFREVPRQSLPPVVWAECSNCSKFYKCDEVGMIHVL